MQHILNTKGDLAYLHPVCRPRFQKLQERLHAEYRKPGGPKVWFLPFETYRSPVDQAKLFRQGRTEPGRIVTKADAWQSPHQYGVAADFVPRRPKDPQNTNGPWVWDWEAADDADWACLSTFAADLGLSCPIVWDRPHVLDPVLWDDFKTIIKYHMGRGA